jgi:hypothetical protein
MTVIVAIVRMMSAIVIAAIARMRTLWRLCAHTVKKPSASTTKSTQRISFAQLVAKHSQKRNKNNKKDSKSESFFI